MDVASSWAIRRSQFGFWEKVINLQKTEMSSAIWRLELAAKAPGRAKAVVAAASLKGINRRIHQEFQDNFIFQIWGYLSKWDTPA